MIQVHRHKRERGTITPAIVSVSDDPTGDWDHDSRSKPHDIDIDDR